MTAWTWPWSRRDQQTPIPRSRGLRGAQVIQPVEFPPGYAPPSASPTPPVTEPSAPWPAPYAEVSKIGWGWYNVEIHDGLMSAMGITLFGSRRRVERKARRILGRHTSPRRRETWQVT